MNEQKNKCYELTKLNELFDKGKRIFRVPDYQRGYSWENEQRSDLIKDIENVIKREYKYTHYTGTIVASYNKEETENINGKYQVYDIVDGQQRLTSLVILISIICKNINTEEKRKTLTDNYIACGIEKGNTIRKFKTGAEQDELFEDIIIKRIKENIIKNKVNTKADRNIIDAYNQFNKWVNQKNAENILKSIFENIGFLFYAPENNKEIGIMFEVINNRGKDLSQLEKIKNYLIYFSNINDKKDIKNAVNRCWPKILKRLNNINFTSNDEENSFLRYCWIVFKDTNKSKSYYVYENLKEVWPPDKPAKWKEITNFVNFIDRSAATYEKLFNTRKSDGYEKEKEETILERIYFHPQNSSIIPLIISTYERIGDSNEKLIELLDLIEKLNFRYYVAGIANRSDSRQGTLFSLAHKFFIGKDKDGNNLNYNWLKNELVTFINDEANDSKFIQYLTLDKDEAGNYEYWQGLKFFLASYEENLRKKHKEKSNLAELLSPRNKKSYNSFYHKEHIWAKADRPDKFDKGDLNVNKRRLGNFILLREGDNKHVSNKKPEEKINSLYTDSNNGQINLNMIPETINVFQKSVIEENTKGCWKSRRINYWQNVYTRFLDLREKKLLDFAIKRWKVKGLKKTAKSVNINSMLEKNEIYDLNY